MTDWGQVTWGSGRPGTPLDEVADASPDLAVLPKWRPRRPELGRRPSGPVADPPVLYCDESDVTPEEYEQAQVERRARLAEFNRRISGSAGRRIDTKQDKHKDKANGKDKDEDKDAGTPKERRAADLLMRDSASWRRSTPSGGVIE